MSELRSGVHALKNRFELGRREMTADFRQMAGELHAASDAFRERHGHLTGSFFSRPTRPVTATEDRQGFEAQEHAKTHGDRAGKKRHG